jgi:uroporphyrin-3 C-methyltransferase
VSENSGEPTKKESSKLDADSAPEEKQKTAAEPKSKNQSKGGAKKIVSALLWLIVLVLLASVLYLYFLVEKQKADIADNFDRELSLMATRVELESSSDTINTTLNNAERERQKFSEALDTIDARLGSQQSRILAMSTTSRDDWLLAEAEYLLKLANQRVLVERKAETAIGLLQEADNILRDLGDPDLFELRSAIKNDLVALKLVKQSDIEGIYLELAALANQVDALPLVPKAYNYQNDAAEPENETIEADAKGNSVSKFFSSLSDYVRIVRHSERPAAILPPDESAYLQLNLRLMIEQAQLALLREEIQIYQQSLTDATSWLEKYFPSTQAADQYVAELKRLREIDIVITLPDISESLGMLQNYISVLHKLDEESAPSAQVKQEEGA